MVHKKLYNLQGQMYVAHAKAPNQSLGLVLEPAGVVGDLDS